MWINAPQGRAPGICPPCSESCILSCLGNHYAFPGVLEIGQAYHKAQVQTTKGVNKNSHRGQRADEEPSSMLSHVRLLTVSVGLAWDSRLGDCMLLLVLLLWTHWLLETNHERKQEDCQSRESSGRCGGSTQQFSINKHRHLSRYFWMTSMAAFSYFKYPLIVESHSQIYFCQLLSQLWAIIPRGPLAFFHSLIHSTNIDQ